MLTQSHQSRPLAEPSYEAERLSAIIATQQEIATAELDLGTLMNLIVERARQITGAAGATVELIEGEEMVCRAASGLATPLATTRRHINSGLAGLCVRTGEILRSDDATGHAPGEDAPGEDATLHGIGAKSVIVVPLRHNRSIIGVLKVLSPQTHAFSDTDAQTLQLMAGLMAASMSHAAEFEARQTTLAALRESADLFRSVTQTANDAIVAGAVNGGITYFNYCAEEMFGYSVNEVLGQPLTFLLPERRQDVTRPRLGVLGQTIEIVAVRKGGARFPAEVSLAHWDAGGQTFYTAIVRDITKRKELSGELTRFFTLSLDMLCIAGFDGYFKRLNPAWEKTFGYTTEELSAQPYLEFIHPDDREVMEAEVWKLLIGATTTISFENRFRRKDGSYRWLLWKATAWMGQHLMYAVAHDITAHKWAEESLYRTQDELEMRVLQRTAELAAVNEALRSEVAERKHAEKVAQHANEQLQAVLDAVPESISWISSDLKYLGINSHLASFIRLGPSVMVGRSVGFLRGNPYGFPEFVHEFFAGTKDADSREIEIDVNFPQGASVRTHLVMAQKYMEGKAAVFVGIDITERKEAEVALRRARDELEMRVLERTTELAQANDTLARTAEELTRSNLELEQFAYVASHDLQEPLRMVASYLQLIERRYRGQLDSDADEFIGFAVDGAKRMQVLIHDLLEYSRVGTRGKAFESTDCAAVLEEVIANLHVAILESEAAVTHDALPVVLADPIQLTQLLQNLIGNAIKFRRPEAPVQVHVTAAHEGAEWVFSVRDNGIGIPAGQAERIFNIFQRLHTRDQYPGTGIGLAICKRIVERHGGRIWVESQPEHGSTFFFTIPDSKDHVS